MLMGLLSLGVFSIDRTTRPPVTVGAFLSVGLRHIIINSKFIIYIHYILNTNPRNLKNINTQKTNPNKPQKHKPQTHFQFPKFWLRTGSFETPGHHIYVVKKDFKLETLKKTWSDCCCQWLIFLLSSFHSYLYYGLIDVRMFSKVSMTLLQACFGLFYKLFCTI